MTNSEAEKGTGNSTPPLFSEGRENNPVRTESEIIPDLGSLFAPEPKPVQRENPDNVSSGSYDAPDENSIQTAAAVNTEKNEPEKTVDPAEDMTCSDSYDGNASETAAVETAQPEVSPDFENNPPAQSEIMPVADSTVTAAAFMLNNEGKPASAPQPAVEANPVVPQPQNVTEDKPDYSRFTSAAAGKIPELPAKFKDPEAIGRCSFGETVRELREISGYSLRQLAELTKIRETYLLALEEEDFDTLPPLIYIIAYLRQLAKFYQLSNEVSDALTAELRSHLEYEKPENAAKQVIGTEKNEENDRILRKIIISIISIGVLILLIVGIIIFLLLRPSAEKDATPRHFDPAVLRSVVGPANITPLQLKE